MREKETAAIERVRQRKRGRERHKEGTDREIKAGR